MTRPNPTGRPTGRPQVFTLPQLRRLIKPAKATIDAAGCLEIWAPAGHHFEAGMHSLVTDPQMYDPTGSPSALYWDAYQDFLNNRAGGFKLCPPDCACKEEPEV